MQRDALAQGAHLPPERPARLRARPRHARARAAPPAQALRLALLGLRRFALQRAFPAPRGGAGPGEHEDRAADDEAPEGAADAIEADARGRDEEGRQRRLAFGGVGERVVQRRAEGVEQGEARPPPRRGSASRRRNASRRPPEDRRRCKSRPRSPPRSSACAGSGEASGEAHSAAVIALRFTAWPPNGAARSVKTPVAAMTGPGSGR